MISFLVFIFQIKIFTFKTDNLKTKDNENLIFRQFNERFVEINQNNFSIGSKKLRII